MGKASKWIRSFLLGKKDEKCKKNVKLLQAESLATPKAILSSSSKVRRRWSFKRLGNADVNIYKRTGSFDSGFTYNQLVKQDLLECEIEQIRAILIGQLSNGVVKTVSPETSPETRLLGDEAATKIQAAFRAYLARKALCALRGLVKIQALVRGHLVRKRTTETIRCMNALMAIQTRARVQRVQTTEEVQTAGKRGLSYRESSNDNQFISASNDEVNLKIDKSGPILRSKSRDFIRLDAGRTEDEFNFTRYQSGRHSISKIERYQSPYLSPSTLLSDYDRQVAEFPFRTRNRISQHRTKESKTKQTIGSFTLPHTETSNSTSFGCRFTPTYMSKTESSRAKNRSKSEPKQRPNCGIKQKRTQPSSIESMNVNKMDQEKQQPLLSKLHDAARSSIDSRCNSTGTILYNSCCRNLIACQAPISLY